MPNRRFQRRGAPVGHRRSTNWISLFDDPDNALSVADNGAALLLTRTIVSSVVAPSTIVRIRGQVGLSGTLPVNSLLGIGIAVVSDQAAALGITAVSHPITDSEWDGWLWTDSRYIGSGNFNTLNEWPIDSKAMRKWDDDQSLVVVAENIGINVGGGAIIVSVNARLLIKGA